MKQKAVTLINRGMSRDLSISKVDGSSAYENRNIRITVRDNDTTLSVTNERGTKEVSVGGSILGDLIGWNVLNNHIILFTHDSSGFDRIYRIDYDGDNFRMALGYKDEIYGKPLYTGHLGFDVEHPIESVVYFETDAIQKVYWVDGIHPLRFMNIMATKDEIAYWNDNSFDSDIFADYGVTVNITKDYSGNTRPNGVVQYLMTYYNKHGQETGYVWISDLVYLSPRNNGGSADGTNNNKVSFLIRFANDNRFTNFRIYSIFRSSLNQATTSYLVADGKIVTGVDVRVSDDGAHPVPQDISRLLYLGSLDVHPYTLTHKDQTLFLGGIESTGQDYSWLKEYIRNYGLYDPSTGLVNDGPGHSWKWVNFLYDGSVSYPEDTGTYSHDSQLVYTSSQILTFKGGEKYRFAISFQTKNGAMTPAFWIGDAVNTLYPVIDVNNHVINRVIARFVMPEDIVDYMEEKELVAVRLMVAEATYADRSVKAQGILNPTVFNVWERFNSRLYASPSWISRPRRSGFATAHFDPVKNSTSSSGEIQCNYWETTEVPTPYYRVENGEIVDELDGVADYDHLMIVYGYYKIQSKAGHNNDIYFYRVLLLKAKGELPSPEHNFTDDEGESIFYATSPYSVPNTDFVALAWGESGDYKFAYGDVANFLRRNGVVDTRIPPDENTWRTWFNDGNKDWRWRVYGDSTTTYDQDNPSAALNANVWHTVTEDNIRQKDAYLVSLHKRHLMFLDENLITLNSPEFDYEAVSVDIKDNSEDFYKLRIVGVAKITGGYSDYVVDATHGKLSGENLVSASFESSLSSEKKDGLTAWPLWKELGLQPKSDSDTSIDVKDRNPSFYQYGPDIYKYWLYMWNHGGNIDGFSNDGENDNSSLMTKTFANLRYSGCTMYALKDYRPSFDLDSVRISNSTTSQYIGVNVGGETVYYDGCPDMFVSLPGSHKYPILYSKGSQDENEYITVDTKNADLFTNEPVRINYMSSPHVVMSLNTSVSGGTYTQRILPWISVNDMVGINSGAKISWADKDYVLYQPQYEPLFDPSTDTLSDSDKYVFIGELYYDYDAEGAIDNRYGGISDFAIQNNRFIPAGPIIRRVDLPEVRFRPSPSAPEQVIGRAVVGDSGDTYFQRWDCLKTRPVSAAANSVNNVIDVTSVMIETHINLDGRTDLLRGTKYLASIDPEKFGSINPVYSQMDNFFVSRQLDDDADMDIYRSSITWTLDKSDSADIDEWTHVTLANSLSLDGDKGWCRALRRFNNSIIAFQDRAISEVLFNSRTQLSTTSGVPVEIANSGKVDGKRYISNKFGCVNKWSIVEGKAALYFVDNINKVFCSFGGDGIQPLSTRLGFDAWFRRINSIEPWTPKVLAGDKWNNMVSYYDRIHSDIYLVGSGEAYGDIPCLVYNESLGMFTSFYDYSKVPMMANVDDRFVSVRDHKLWLQNEGLYCNFFGADYGYSIEYRVTPDPFGDKIWTNVDYRADYYRLLDDAGDSVVPERLMINGEFYDDIAGTYQDTKTFDSLRIWNEYQNTGEVALGRDYTTDRTTRRKFRIWHVAIPRSVRTERNRWGLDRIRNPWISLLFRKNANADNRQDMAQIHDVTVRYFE